jgi:hypothetical protein
MSPSSPPQSIRVRSLRPRRRWILRVLAVALVLAGAAIGGPSAAHADTGYGYCQAVGCNNLDPYYENCETNAYPVSSWKAYGDQSDSYEVTLMYSPDCEANWASVLTTNVAAPFCVVNTYGNIARYTSVPGLVSWTDMINGDPGSHDTAWVQLQSYLPGAGEFATDESPWRGGPSDYPC